MNDDQLDDLLRDAGRSYNVPPAVPRDLMWARIEAARKAGSGVPPVHRRTSPWVRTATGVAAVLLVGVAIGRTTRVSVPAGVALVAPTGPTAPVARASGVFEPAQPDEPASGGLDAAVATRGERTLPSRFARRGPAGAAEASGRDGRTYGVTRSTPGVVGAGTEMNVHRLAVVEHLARTEVLLTGFRARERSEGRAATPADAEQFGRLSRELLQNTRLLLATRATDDPLLQRLLEDLELVLMQIAQYAADGGARRGDLDAINQSLDRRNVLPKLRSTIPAGAPAPSGT